MNQNPLNRRSMLLSCLYVALLSPHTGGGSGGSAHHKKEKDDHAAPKKGDDRSKENDDASTPEQKGPDPKGQNVATTELPPDASALPEGQALRGRVMEGETGPIHQLPFTATTPDIIAALNKVILAVNPKAPMLRETVTAPLSEEDYHAALANTAAAPVEEPAAA